MGPLSLCVLGRERRGGCTENGWKRGGRRSGGVTDESPPTSSERLISCCLRSRGDRVRKHYRRVNVFFHVVWVCVTLRVWELLEVLDWATERCQMFLCEVEAGLAAGQSGAVISTFSPAPLVRFLFFLQLWEKVTARGKLELKVVAFLGKKA